MQTKSDGSKEFKIQKFIVDVAEHFLNVLDISLGQLYLINLFRKKIYKLKKIEDRIIRLEVENLPKNLFSNLINIVDSFKEMKPGNAYNAFQIEDLHFGVAEFENEACIKFIRGGKGFAEPEQGYTEVHLLDWSDINKTDDDEPSEDFPALPL